MTTVARLHKSSTDRMLCGLSGGLAEHFNVEPSLVRLGWIVFACVTAGAAVIGYLFLCLVVPDEGDVAVGTSNPSRFSSSPDEQRADEMSEEAQVLLKARQELGPEYEDELLDSFVERAEDALRSRRLRTGRQTGLKSGQIGGRGVLPLVLLCIGAVIVLANIGSLSWFVWLVLCPLVLMAVGTVVLARRAN